MFNWSCLTFKLNTPIIITSLVMMLCFLAHCIDVNTDNKRRSKIQRAAHLKTETETFKYFSYFLYMSIKNIDGRKQKLLRERIAIGGDLFGWLIYAQKNGQLEVSPGGLIWGHHLTVLHKEGEEVLWERFSRNLQASLCLCKRLVNRVYQCLTSTWII